MDGTPNSLEKEAEDSGCFTSSFQNSKITFESTPNTTPNSSLDLSRKRKGSLLATPSLINIAEICPKPHFSSTFNESLLNNLEKCSITPSYYLETSEEKPVKYMKLSDNKPTPSTPVKDKPHSSFYNESPYKETLDILYPTKRVIPARKTLTPQKGNSSKKIFSPAKKRLFEPTRVDPMKYFKGNAIVLSKIFENLSDGDLYRTSMVNKNWKEALFSDRKAHTRYLGFLERHKINKENYTITPPDSPASPESPPVSPSRQQFHAYTKVAKTLVPGQSLVKCPACTRPSIMEKNIGQCQNLLCGYIFCSLCLSFSKTGPEDFYDKCQRSQLLVEKRRRSSRFSLSDLSNSDFDSGFLTELSHSSRNDTSEMESPVHKVKRNLVGRFSDKTTVLAESNRCVNTTQHYKRRRSSLVPVISNDVKETVDVVEPPSPPKVKLVACSKESKKNLKRLLR